MFSILLVDDDPNFRKLILIGLEDFFNSREKYRSSSRSEKYKIYTAGDGYEAIEILKKETIALLVTDIRMPKINGLVLLAYMNINHPGVPCIVMSGFKKPAMNKELMEDLLHYMEKPFRPEELGETILRKLNQPKHELAEKEISIANFLQLIAMEKETCILQVETRGGRKGSFFIENGQLLDAIFGKSKGIEAAMKMIPMQSENIDFYPLPTHQMKKEQKTGKSDVKDLYTVIRKAMESAY